MPLPNEHAAEVRSSEGFARIRRQSRTVEGKPVSMLFGVDQSGKTTLISYRFPKDKWPAAEARAFAAKHDAKRFVPAVAPPARKPKKMSLSAAVLSTGSLGPAVAVSSQGDRDGQPSRRYVKDILRVGQFTKPGHFDLDVTAEDLEQLAGNFQAMQTKGVRVPVTLDHSRKAEDVVGQLTDVYVDDGTLYGVHELVGQRALDMVAQPAVEVSAELDMDYVAADNSKLGKALTASTLCQKPVVPGQGRFKVAASRDGKSCELDAQVLILSTAGDTVTGDEDMNETLKFLRETLKIEGLKDDADEAACLEALKAWHKDQHATALSRAKETETALKAKVDALEKAKPDGVKLSRTEEALSRRALDSDMQRLVDGGNITPACAKDLRPFLATPVMLSVAKDSDDPSYSGIISALAKNDPVELKEKTGGQFEMSRPGDSDGDDDFDEDTNKEMLEMTWYAAAGKKE